MENTNLQQHWENVYTKQNDASSASWYQQDPKVVMEWINAKLKDKEGSVIDIGGGDSVLTDRLLAEGYKNITVLDISCKALEKARLRLGESALTVTWICEDASAFTPSRTYTLWHDRAAFHFLNSKAQKEGYKHALNKGVAPGGWVILATFSKNGPLKCSGLEITQYSEEELADFMGDNFTLEGVKYHDHITPGGGTQNFIYTLFRKKQD